MQLHAPNFLTSSSWPNAVLDIDAEAEQDEHHAEHCGRHHPPPVMQESQALARRGSGRHLPCPTGLGVVMVMAAVFRGAHGALPHFLLLLLRRRRLVFLLPLALYSSPWRGTITVLLLPRRAAAVLLVLGGAGRLRRLRGRVLLAAGGAGLDLDGLRRDAGHGDADDAVLEPGVDGLGVAAVGDAELEVEAAPAVAGDGALPAHDQAPVAVHHLHPDVLLPVPCSQPHAQLRISERG